MLVQLLSANIVLPSSAFSFLAGKFRFMGCRLLLFFYRMGPVALLLVD